MASRLTSWTSVCVFIIALVVATILLSGCATRLTTTMGDTVYTANIGLNKLEIPDD